MGALRKGRVYVNVHPQNFPQGGERLGEKLSWLPCVPPGAASSGESQSILGTATVYIINTASSGNTTSQPSIDYRIGMNGLTTGLGGAPESISIRKGTPGSSTTILHTICGGTSSRPCALGTAAACVTGRSPSVTTDVGQQAVFALVPGAIAQRPRSWGGARIA